MAIDIDFDQGELDSNTQIILKAATTAEATAVKESYKIIITIAKELSIKYVQMLQQISNFQNQLKHTIKVWHTFKASCQENGQAFKSTTAYDEYIRSRQRIKRESFSTQIQNNILSTYKLAMKFQEYLNAALNQIVATTYVWVNSKGVPETYVVYDMSQFLKTDVDRYGNVVVRYRNNAKLLRQHTQKVQDSIRENSDFNYAALKDAYLQISNKYQTYKVRGGSFILWLYPYGGQKWNGVLVSSFGSINEAYATILLHQHFNPSDVPEDSQEQFMLYVLGVTNLSGTLEGDTSVGHMELAVKSKNATTLSIQQLYNMAQEIINNKLDNFQSIQKYLVTIKQGNAKAQHGINVSLKAALQNIADENLGQIINNFSK